MLLIYRFSHMLFEKRSGFFRQTDTSFNVIQFTCRNKRNVTLVGNVYLVLTTWVTVENSSKCVTMLGLLFNRNNEAFVKNADPVRRTLWKFYWFMALVIMLFEITDWHVIHALVNTQVTYRNKRNITWSLVENIYLFFNNMGHGRKLFF